MTRALPVTQRQAQALLRAAEAEHGIVEVKVGETVFRLIPGSLAQNNAGVDKPLNPENFDTLDDYLSWRDQGNAREN